MTCTTDVGERVFLLAETLKFFTRLGPFLLRLNHALFFSS